MKSSFFSRLSDIFSKNSSPAGAQPPKKKSVADSQALKNAKLLKKELIAQAESESKQFLLEIQKELSDLRQEYIHLEKELDKKNTSFSAQESLFLKKQKNLEQLQKDVDRCISEMQKHEELLLQKLELQSSQDRQQISQKILQETELSAEQETQKELQIKLSELTESIEQKTQEILTQVMPQGAHSYVSEYSAPIITFPSVQMCQKVCGAQMQHISLIEQMTGVEITFDEQQHQIKLYAYNTVEREIVRVLFERLLKTSQVSEQSIKQIYQMTRKDLEREMYNEGKYLCNQLNVYDLPVEIVERLGMFKFRYSYGQNMIVHTLEEAKIGIALARELGADTNIVRLGCLFHDIGKVLYEFEGNHVETGVEFLRQFKIPEAVVSCVAESHEDIPFSSIESMIVHVADSISGARPGARFDDYEGFLKHQQGLVDISLAHSGVTDAYVINGGREIRVTVDPDQINDDKMDELATKIRDQVQEFSTYPGSIVVNMIREVQYSQLAA